jgi:hypothetical protein
MERATITSSFTKRQGFSSHQRTDNKAPSYRPLLQNKIKRKKPQSGIILKKVEEVQQQQ